MEQIIFNSQDIEESVQIYEVLLAEFDAVAKTFESLKPDTKDDLLLPLFSNLRIKTDKISSQIETLERKIREVGKAYQQAEDQNESVVDGLCVFDWGSMASQERVSGTIGFREARWRTSPEPVRIWPQYGMQHESWFAAALDRIIEEG